MDNGDLTVISKKEGSALISNNLYGTGTITFDLTDVKGNQKNSVFQVSASQEALDFTDITINLAGAISNWIVGDSITLFSTTRDITGIDHDGRKITYDKYTFLITNDEGQVIATLILITETQKGGGNSNSGNSSGGQSALIIIENPLEDVINPTIHSISAEQHPDDTHAVVLLVDASTEGHSVHLYQWQKLNEDGTWEHIGMTTSGTFEYHELQSGMHTFRCIVGNGTGGITESESVEYTVP